MIKLTFVLFLITGVTVAYSQNTTIMIEFLKDGKPVKLKSKSSVNLILPLDTLVFPIQNNRFTVPDSVNKSNQRYFFNLNGNLIAFTLIPFSWNDKVLSPQWTVILDTLPIEEERRYLAKRGQKPVKWLGVLANGTGAQYTHYGYNKYKKGKIE